MTKKPVSNIGASVRQRLLNLRDQTGEDAQALFTQFAIERFLYLSCSRRTWNLRGQGLAYPFPPEDSIP